jgi:hypothetical protein
MIGSQLRGGGRTRMSESAATLAASDAGSGLTSTSPCSSSLLLGGEDDAERSSGRAEDSLGASSRHFSRTRRRFGVCGPRADSGENPSKASQAAAKPRNTSSLRMGTEVGRLRNRTSLGPEPAYVYMRKGGRGMSSPCECMKGTYEPTQCVHLTFCSRHWYRFRLSVFLQSQKTAWLRAENPFPSSMNQVHATYLRDRRCHRFSAGQRRGRVSVRTPPGDACVLLGRHRRAKSANIRQRCYRGPDA